MRKNHARRSGQFLPKLAPGQSNSELTFQTSPQGHPTPSSHASSPTSISTRSPMVVHQGGNTPPTSTVLAQPQTQQFHTFSRASQQPPNQAFYNPQQVSPNAQRPAQRPGPPPHYQSNASIVSSHSTGSRNSLNPSMNAGRNEATGPLASQYYPSPMQKHFDQLGKLSPMTLIELCSS